MTASTVTRVVLLGATGRMGGAVADCLTQSPAFIPAVELAGSVRRSSAVADQLEGLDANGQSIAIEGLLRQASVAIDFSLPSAVERHATLCSNHNLPYVCGVTALSDSTLEALAEEAVRIPVLWAPNMSTGVTICFGAVADIAARLAPGFSVAITDIHHSGKLDAPSGTALEFGRVITGAADHDPVISYDSVREGTHPGEHHIVFRAGGDEIEVRHRAGNRTEFASGAVRAACWLIGRPPGLYNMRNVLGITSSS